MHNTFNRRFSQKITFLLSLTLITSLLLLQGCDNPASYQSLPKDLEDQVYMPGFPDVRVWGDTKSTVLENSAIESLAQEKAYNHGKLKSEVSILALSSGGADGAFGVGILYGWAQAGTRPDFKIVTGISTGALMAPFAFLGQKYDEKMKDGYTSISDKNVYSAHGIFPILLSLLNIKELPSLADSRPLAQLIDKWVDARMLQEIAAEHRKGRRLLIGTTQLNAQRLVIWDMGTIAASNHVGALELFRKVMLASASTPAMLPPQYFDVEVAGKKYKEMHVDGAISTQTMLFEDALNSFSKINSALHGQKRKRILYIIRNEQVLPQWSYVKPQLKDISMRSINSCIRSGGIGDFYRLYAFTQRYDFDYNLAFIPATFKAEQKSEFDNEYMKKLFVLGSEMGRAGYPWHKEPPGFEN